jgi:hypothetical protein
MFAFSPKLKGSFMWLSAATLGLLGGPAQAQYDLKAEIARLDQLRQEGKDLRLVVGRTNGGDVPPIDAGNPPLPAIPNGAWVFGDIRGTNRFGPGDPIQLTMDFNDPAAVAQLPANTFTYIIYDASVFAVMSNARTVLPIFRELLKPGGYLCYSLAAGFLPYILDPDIPAQAKEYRQRTDERVLRPLNQYPPVLYHFSNPMGLVGIVEAKRAELRALQDEELGRLNVNYLPHIGFRRPEYRKEKKYPIENQYFARDPVDGKRDITSFVITQK